MNSAVEKPLLCIDCKHHQFVNNAHHCFHPALGINPVDGSPIYLSCHTLRTAGIPGTFSTDIPVATCDPTASNFEPAETAHTAVPIAAYTGIPLPGQYWTEQASFYAGITPMGHHLLLPDAPEFRFKEVAWGKGKNAPDSDSDHDGLANTIAMAAAGSVLAERIRALPGDAYLPSRLEAALLYATLKDKLPSGWHWTSTQYNASFAWGCYFGDGLIGGTRKSFEGSAVAVRRLPISSSIL